MKIKLSFSQIILFLVFSISLDYFYVNIFIMQIIFSLLLILLIRSVFLNKQIFFTQLLLTLLIIFDADPKLLYENNLLNFQSISNSLFFGITPLEFVLYISLFYLLKLALKQKIIISKFLLFFVYYFILVGIIGVVLFDKNELGATNLVHVVFYYCLFLFVTIFTLFNNLKNIDYHKIYSFLINISIAKLTSSILLFVLGRYEIYGAMINTISVPVSITEILFAYLFSLLLYKFYRNRSNFLLTIFILSISFFEIARRFQRSIFVNLSYIVVLIFSILLYKKKIFLALKKNYLIVISVLTIILFGLNKYYDELIFIDQFSNEIFGLLEISKSDSGDLRVLEWKNIIYENSSNFYSTLFGSGFNNLVEFDDKFSYYTYFTSSDYSQDMINAGHYYPHSAFNIFLLKGGIIGFAMYLFFCLKFFFKIGFNLKEKIHNNEILSFPLLLTAFLLYNFTFSFGVSFANSIFYGLIIGLTFKHNKIKI